MQEVRTGGYGRLNSERSIETTISIPNMLIGIRFWTGETASEPTKVVSVLNLVLIRD